MTFFKEPRSLGPQFRAFFPVFFFAAVALGALGVALTHLFVPSAAQSSSVAALEGQQYAAVQLPAFDRNPLLIDAHSTIGVMLVLTAPFQFWSSFRAKHRQVHRVMGYIAVSCLALLSTSGLAVAIVYPFSGVAGVIPNILWMSCILFCTAMAVRYIRRRDVRAHQIWIARAMAITLGITFSTLYQPILIGLIHLSARSALAVSFWLGVVECLTVAEIWLRRPRGPLDKSRRR